MHHCSLSAKLFKDHCLCSLSELCKLNIRITYSRHCHLSQYGQAMAPPDSRSPSKIEASPADPTQPRTDPPNETDLVASMKILQRWCEQLPHVESVAPPYKAMCNAAAVYVGDFEEQVC